MRFYISSENRLRYEVTLVTVLPITISSNILAISIGNCACRSQNMTVSHSLPGSKSVPLQFLRKWDEDKATVLRCQYCNEDNASIAKADAAAISQLQQNASLVLLYAVLQKPESHRGHDIIQMSIIASLLPNIKITIPANIFIKPMEKLHI